ncbi:hypothetical protein [Microvirus D_HF5_96]|nr:hypothetical protein [Microvirus D_HF5_96]
MKFIKREYPIVERCEFAIYLERRLTKHGDSELVVFRLELEDGRYFCFKTFDCLIEFMKINL